MNIQKLNEAISELLEDTKIYEFALDRAKVKSDLNNQMIPLFQHIAKLQLFGYDSDVVKTIFDIYSNLNDINDSKKGRSFMTTKNIRNWLLDFVINEEDYLNALDRLYSKLKDNYYLNSTISYENYNRVQKYLLDLLSTGEIVDKNKFENNILTILGVTK